MLEVGPFQVAPSPRDNRTAPPLLSAVELITFEILAAERLRLMGFDNRLIIDCFANVVNILIVGYFLR